MSLNKILKIAINGFMIERIFVICCKLMPQDPNNFYIASSLQIMTKF